MALRSIRIDDKYDDQLDILCDMHSRDRSSLVNQALREFVERNSLEMRMWQGTISALEDVRAGRVVPSGEVHAWLRSKFTNSPLPMPIPTSKK